MKRTYCDICEEEEVLPIEAVHPFCDRLGANALKFTLSVQMVGASGKAPDVCWTCFDKMREE